MARSKFEEGRSVLSEELDRELEVVNQLAENPLQKKDRESCFFFLSTPSITENLEVKKVLKKIQKIFIKTQKEINAADTPMDMFMAGASLETRCCVLMNKTLHQFHLDSQVKEHVPLLDLFNRLQEELLSFNLCLAQHVEEILEKSALSEAAAAPEAAAAVVAPEAAAFDPLEDMQYIAQRIETPQLAPPDPIALENATQFMRELKCMVLSTLLKVSRSEKGRDFIHQLAENLSGEKKLYIRLTLTSDKTAGVAVDPTDEGWSVKVDKEVVDKHAPLENRASKGVNPSKGASSALILPLVVSPKQMQKVAAGDINSIFRFNDFVQNQMRLLMQGGLAFDSEGVNYSPFQIQLLHELIHVLHNAQGNNSRAIPLSPEEKKNWTSYEEYMTIEGGAISEADFVVDYGARPRHAHAAASTQILFDAKVRNPNITLRQLQMEHGAHHHEEKESEYKM